MMALDYAELLIHLPDNANLKDARSLRQFASRSISKHLEQPIDPRLWHRDPETNKPLNDVPLVRWSTRGRGDLARITAAGDVADVLRRDGHQITQALAAEYGQPLQERWSTGPCRVMEQPYPTRYRIPMLLLTRSHRSAARQRHTYDATQVAETIRATVRKGIERQGDRLGLDLPDIVVGGVDWGGHDGQPKLIRPWPDRPKDYAMAVFNVQVELYLRLDGPWSAGYLQSHGYGVLLRSPGRQAVAA